MQNDLTKGSVFSNIVRFSMPYFAAYFLQTFYGLADLFITGRFCGAETITAVANGSQVMHFVTVVIVGLSVGTTVMIAHEVGRGSSRSSIKTSSAEAGEHARGNIAGASKKAGSRIDRIIGNTVTVFAAFALLMTAVLIFCARGIVAVMQAPPEAQAGMLTYIMICFAGIPFITAYNVIAAVFRGLGDSRTPMVFVGIACVLNVGLDFLMIGGFSMGAAGAALATIIAQTTSVLLALMWIRIRNRQAEADAAAERVAAAAAVSTNAGSETAAGIADSETGCRTAGDGSAGAAGAGSAAASGTGIRFTRADLAPDRDIIEGFMRIGLPIACQDAFIQVSFLVITAIANSRGVEIAAAVGIVEKIITFLFLVQSSMLSTISSVGAQAVGAGLYERARKILFTGMALSVAVNAVFTVTFQFASEDVLSLFTSNADVVEYGSQYLRTYILDAVLTSIHFCFSGYFSCIGMSIWSFIHNAASIVLVRIPGAYLASKLFPDSLYPMGLAAPAGSLLSAVICVCVYIYIQKKTVYGGKDITTA